MPTLNFHHRHSNTWGRPQCPTSPAVPHVILLSLSIAAPADIFRRNNLPASPWTSRSIDDVCLRVDITIIVDGVERATVSLPPFLPATTGTFLWGQRMVKPPKTVEQKFKDDLFAKMMANAPLQTSSILEPYVDNNLQLVYDNLRARSLTEDQLFGASVSKEAFRGPFTEREPWRDPYSKYCRLTIGGGFNPWTALSANIDEIRLYAYAKHADDVSLDMGYVINGDVGISFSPQVSNYSLIMYHSFDIDSVKFKQFQRDDYTLWPLDVKDFSPTSGVALCPDCVGLLGGGTFQYAPLQVPSTAPLFGARSIQVLIVASPFCISQAPDPCLQARLLGMAAAWLASPGSLLRCPCSEGVLA